MTSKNGTAEIVDMEDARARRQAGDLPAANYRHSGAHLAAVREALGLSLGEAASRMQLKEAQLEAIETLDLPSLPPRPYAIGFVKAYAKFLELDEQEIVDRFKEDAGFESAAKIETEN